MTDPVDIAEGRRLLEAATKEPWAVPVANVFRVIAPEEEHHNPKQGMTPGYPWRIVAEVGAIDGSSFDAALIVWLRNHASELLDAYEAAHQPEPGKVEKCPAGVCGRPAGHEGDHKSKDWLNATPIHEPVCPTCEGEGGYLGHGDWQLCPDCGPDSETKP